ncbi:hypothetical protein MRB53_022926 [Persea americana]|uniref:Uncharacterized protein n=1 Tax=Persea americana TaxID=3435 RepID=A0ACC2L8H7_PERAE|nr:hypothetical protein MRB53_022926 [Persea americana]
MAEAAVGVFLDKLYELIEREAKLIGGVSSDVRLLHEKLQWISLSLEEADNKCSEDKEINLRVCQVRDATFQAEDIIEKYVLSVKENPINRAMALHRIGKEIKKINSRLDNISENKSNLGLGNVQVDRVEASTSAVRKKKNPPGVKEVDIVGIQDEAKIISKMLVGGDAGRCVVSIVGMGGLVGDWIKVDFGELLTSLRSLGLHGCLEQYQTALSNFTGKQKNLESLSLITTAPGQQIPTQITSSPLSELEKLHVTGALKMVPTLQQFAPNLTELVLLDSYLTEDPMAIVEQLPKLLVLKLETNSYFGQKMCCSANGFPALAVLKIKFLEFLQDWTVAEGAFANLRLMEICGCPNLKMSPEDLQHVTTLQELFLLRQPPQFLQRVQKNGSGLV